MAKTIELGDVVRDKVTGFEGVAIGVTTWLHGCRRITVQPRALKDGRPIEPLSFDEPQLEIVETKVVEQGSRKTGGPRPEPTRR
jgi:hypothetical protein